MMFEIMNSNFEKLCEITSWKSILWHPQYLSETGGDFEMELPLEYSTHVKKDFYILKEGSKKFGIIRTIEKTDTEDGETILKVSGDFGESILGYRVISCVNKTGPFYNLINSILNANFIEPSNAGRRIPNFRFVDFAAFTDKISKQIVGANVAEALCSMCGYRGYGYELSINNAQNGFDFRLLKGTDRSINQTKNTHVVFSKKDFTLDNFTYITSNRNFFTHVTVGGEGDGGSRDFVTVPKNTTEENSGINRREVFLDASNISRTAGKDEFISNADYYAALNTEGYTKLQEAYIDEACEGTVKNDLYELGKDYFFGDIITLIDDDLGIAYSTRVLGALYSYDENGTEELSVEIGNMVYQDFEGEEKPSEDEKDESDTETKKDIGNSIIPIVFTSYGKGITGKPTGFIETHGNNYASVNFSCFLRNFNGEIGECEFVLTEAQYDRIYWSLRKELQHINVPFFYGADNKVGSVVFEITNIKNFLGNITVTVTCSTDIDTMEQVKFDFTRFIPIEKDEDVVITWDIGDETMHEFVKATLHTNGHLEIYGNGNARPYLNKWGDVEWPWTYEGYAPQIFSVSCEETVTFSGVNANSMAYLFAGCSNLTDIGNVRITEGCTTVKSMFYGCTSLEYIPDTFTIPDSVTTTEDMFKYCENLRELPETFNLGSGVISAYGMFYNSGITALPETFSLPDGMRNITAMFRGAEFLDVLPTNFSIPSTVTSMAEFVYGCTNLWNIPDNFRIPANVRDISYAFQWCRKLTGSIVLDTNITTASKYEHAFCETSQNANNPLIVNYTDRCKNIDSMIKNSYPGTVYVVKGSLVE